VCLQKKAIKRCACSPPCFPNSLHFILTIRNNLARHYPVMKPHRAWLFSSEEHPTPHTLTHTNDTHCYWQTQYLHSFRHTQMHINPPIHTYKHTVDSSYKCAPIVKRLRHVWYLLTYRTVKVDIIRVWSLSSSLIGRLWPRGIRTQTL